MARKRPGVLKGILGAVSLFLFVFFMRWALFEVFVIPSGSMYPKLFVNDYIIVSKFDFGLRLPFTEKWILGPYLPSRKSILVFRSPEDGRYFIKRLVGLPGDKLRLFKDFILDINGEPVSYQKLSRQEEETLASDMDKEADYFDAYRATYKNKSYMILTSEGALSPEKANEFPEQVDDYEVAPGHLFFMGDNRHQSYDGRRFGYLDQNKIIGRARFIALSCGFDETLSTGCDLRGIRKDRILNSISR